MGCIPSRTTTAAPPLNRYINRSQSSPTGPTIELVNLKHTTLAKPVAPRHTENKDAVNDEDVPAATVMAGKVSDYLPHSGGIEEFEIGRGGIIGRDVKHATFVLDHSQVSRVHARLTVTKGSVTLADLGSSNGTFCNGVQVTNARVLAPATPLISALSDWSLTANHLKVGRALATFNLPFQMSALQ